MDEGWEEEDAEEGVGVERRRRAARRREDNSGRRGGLYEDEEEEEEGSMVGFGCTEKVVVRLGKKTSVVGLKRSDWVQRKGGRGLMRRSRRSRERETAIEIRNRSSARAREGEEQTRL